MEHQLQQSASNGNANQVPVHNQNQNKPQGTDEQLEAFKIFLTTAPVNWGPNESIRRFALSDGNSVSCVLWNELFHISGTDIVKSLAYRFERLGRTVILTKKFEEGIFSDLRNLKPLSDSTLEESRSPFLKFLYENQCIRTQKKQKVFYWFSVKHDKLFLDALERDLKRESAGQQGCTVSNVPMIAAKAMEMAKAHCMPYIPLKRNNLSIGGEENKWATSSSASYSSHNLSQHQPMQQFHENNSAQYQQQFHHEAPRSYSPAHFSILHPGSPPQGMVTPPLLHQTVVDNNGHGNYRMQVSTLPMGIPMMHRTESPQLYNEYAPEPLHYAPIESAGSVTSSPSLNYVDPSQPQTNSSSIFTSFNNQATDFQQRQYKPQYSNKFAPYASSSSGPSQSLAAPHRPLSAPGTSGALERTFECPEPTCSRQFKRHEHLKRHVRSHTGERPFSCSISDCKRTFSRSDHLQQHLRIHEGNSTSGHLNFSHGNGNVHGNGNGASKPSDVVSEQSYSFMDHISDFNRSDSRMTMHEDFTRPDSRMSMTSGGNMLNSSATTYDALTYEEPKYPAYHPEETVSENHKGSFHNQMDHLMGNILAIDSEPPVIEKNIRRGELASMILAPISSTRPEFGGV